MSLLDKIKKNSTIKETDVLSKSKFFNKKDMIPTAIPAINIALSGMMDGGFTPGITQWVGGSKNFKTMFSLIMAKSYLDKYPDAVMLFYDSEFGTPQAYFDSLDIDTERTVHSPITDIEQLKVDIMNQLKDIQRGDHVIIVVDSIGNLASKKETDDALDGKNVADFSRSKSLKSLFRMITPHLTLKDIPMVVVNHSYKEIGLYPKDIVGGGCLEKGTEIILADGSIKKVEDFIVGDIVQTTVGPKEVTATWNPETLVDGTPECYRVEFEDGSHVICSDTHKFFIDGDWKEAKDLIVGDDCLTA
jgi:RecA/RadA recombinase